MSLILKKKKRERERETYSQAKNKLEKKKKKKCVQRHQNLNDHCMFREGFIL